MGMQSVHAKFQKNSLLGRLIPSGPGVIAVFGPNPFDRNVKKSSLIRCLDYYNAKWSTLYNAVLIKTDTHIGILIKSRDVKKQDWKGLIVLRSKK